MKYLSAILFFFFFASSSQTVQAQAFVPTPITQQMIDDAQNNGAKLPQPFKITNGNQCARMRCASQGCNDCALIWRDLNQDGQVQPRREVRCTCLEGDACVLEREVVNCGNN